MKTLEAYQIMLGKMRVCVMQGTAATAVAGVYGALAVQGKTVDDIIDQKFVVVGAGSAGMGVVSLLALGMIKHVSFSHLLYFHRLSCSCHSQFVNPCRHANLRAMRFLPPARGPQQKADCRSSLLLSCQSCS